MTTSASRRKSPARRPSLSSLPLDLSSAIGADTTRRILLLQFAFALGGLAPLTSDWDPPTLVTDAYCQSYFAGGDCDFPRFVTVPLLCAFDAHRSAGMLPHGALVIA